MAFLKFPAADVASDAFEKLSKGIFDEKHLFVKLLPNIHVSKCFCLVYYCVRGKRERTLIMSISCLYL